MTPDQIRLADRATQIACAHLGNSSGDTVGPAELESVAKAVVELARLIEHYASHNRPTATLTPNPSPDTHK